MTAAPFQTIVGLEVHVQLLTQSKLFCGCVSRFNPDQPNTQTCPVCLGLPGTLPVMNRTAFELAVRTAMVLNCSIREFTKWDRKQYFYPDLPKAYQISQFDLPFSHDGWVDVEVDDRTTTRVRIKRAHLEEDAGKSMHDPAGSRVDLNRCGTPLLEIVTEPDIRSAREARRCMEELRLLLRYLGVSDGNMQEGSLRCDANVNLKIDGPDGEVRTSIVEIKNVNSFSHVEAAITFEEQRQFTQWQQHPHDPATGKQTRGWDAEAGVTFAQRGKELAADYRYFPDPDLIPVIVTADEQQRLATDPDGLPATRRRRYVADGVSRADAHVIVDRGAAFADYFEAVLAAGASPQRAANWMTQDVLRELNEREIAINVFPIAAETLAEVLSAVDAERLSNAGARTVFALLMNEPGAARSRVGEIIVSEKLELVSDIAAITNAVRAVVAANPDAVSDFRAGKQAAVGPLIGQTLRQLGAVDPKVVREVLIAELTD